MSDTRVDVCIVGGSVAGGALACHLASEGLSVCLIERRRRGERKLCAELAQAGLLDRLRSLTGCEGCREAIAVPLDRVEVRAGRFSLGRGFAPGKGFTVDRLSLEGKLLRRAASLGAAVLQPLRARQVVVDDAGAVVRGEGGVEVSAQVVVGADGAASLVGRTLSRPWRRDEIGATRHARLPISPARLAAGSTRVRFDLLPEVGGYGWLVPYREEIGVGAGGFPARGSVDAAYGRLLEALQAETALPLVDLARGRVRGAPVPAAGPSRPTWGERFLLVGDAGGFVSPASGEGLALALASVEAAASALKLCFATTSFGARRLRHYERLWRASMPDFAALSRLREALSGEQGLRWLEACPTDLERLALLAPLVGSADLGAGAEQVLARLRHGTAGAAPEGR